MSAPDVRWLPGGDRAGVYVHVPRHGSWRRVDLPYGGCEVYYDPPEGTVRMVPAEHVEQLERRLEQARGEVISRHREADYWRGQLVDVCLFEGLPLGEDDDPHAVLVAHLRTRPAGGAS